MSSSSLSVNIPSRRIKKTQRKNASDKVIVKAKTPLERIFGSKEHLKDHYFASGSKINASNVRDVLSEPSPFKYPDALDEFAYKVLSKSWNVTERRNEMKLKYNERNNYLTRHQRDMLNRLFVETEDVKTNKTILEIDPEFYTIIEGRPIQEKFNITSYIESIRDILRTKIVTGYRMDDALLIEENLIEEQNMIDEITKQYLLYVQTFEEYLSNDHALSMQLLRQSELEANKAFEKYEVYREKAKELGMLKSQVSNLEEKWRNYKMYQKFLYLVSPMYWRKEHDYYYIADKKYEEEAEASDTHRSLHETDNLRGDSEYRSLEDIIEYFLEDCKSSKEPLLYFKEPYELIKVFRFIELQNLNSLLHSEELAVPLENIKESMAVEEIAFNKQINNLQEIIDNLEGEILWEEERAANLEALARELINGEFKKLICDESILNLHVIVEDVYETCVAPNDANLSAYDMMRAIELKHREYILKLDNLPYERVHKAETECYADEAKTMKIAVEASRKVVQIERMVKRLRRILEPPVEKRIRELKFRSILARAKETEVHIEEPISSEEAEYFHLFTDFCEDTDNIREYREIRRKELEIKEQVIKEHEDEEDNDTNTT